MTNSTEAVERPKIVLVIGPTICDISEIGEVNRSDQTQPIPILDLKSTRMSYGGGAHAFLSVHELQVPAAFITVIGTDHYSDEFLHTVERGGVNPEHVMAIRDPNYQPQINCRQYAGNRLMSRQCKQPNFFATNDDTIMHAFHEALRKYDVQVVVLSDYDKGVCTPHVVTEVISYCNNVDIPVVVDPVPSRFAEYRGATAITPNRKELLEGIGADRTGGIEDASMYVVDHMGIQNCVTTCGEDGIVLARAGLRRVERFEPISADLVDTCGCGDSVVAAVALGMFGDPWDIHTGVNYALANGACQAEKLGAMPVSLAVMHQKLCLASELLKNTGIEGGQTLCRSAREDGLIIGVANGIFDMLHPGHLHLLNEAGEKCDFLVVLLNSDESAERIKRKPTMSYDMRARMLQELSVVDAIIPFDGDTPTPEIIMLEPHLLIKGPEFKDADVPGAAEMEAWGGQFVTVDPGPAMSTTLIIDSIREVQHVPVEEDPAEGEADPSPAVAGDTTD